jgi:hypothetical protein
MYLDPHGLAGDGMLQPVLTKVGDVGEDRRPVLPDLLFPCERPGRMSRLRALVALGDAGDESVEVMTIGGVEQTPDHRNWIS